MPVEIQPDSRIELYGGFVNARHNNIESKLLQSICTDVESESHLQPIQKQNKSTYTASANTEDNALLDN